MSLERLHVGQLVEARIKELGMNVAEFARRMEMSRSNATGMFTRPDLYSKQLYRAGQLLDVDFLLYLSKMGAGEVPDSALNRAGGMADLQIALSEAEQKIAVLQERSVNQQEIIDLQKELLRQHSGAGSATSTKANAKNH